MRMKLINVKKNITLSKVLKNKLKHMKGDELIELVRENFVVHDKF